jgi:uncharacterized membrane protein HdeD (DUF308 family)
VEYLQLFSFGRCAVGFFGIASLLLAVLVLINLALAIRDRSKGKRFTVFYVPPTASRVYTVVLVLSLAVLVILMLATWLLDLPRDYLAGLLAVVVLIESCLSIFYRLRDRKVAPDSPDR